MTLEQLKADIGAVLDSNWKHKEDDFHDDPSNAHIYLTLRRLAVFIGREVQPLPEIFGVLPQEFPSVDEQIAEGIRRALLEVRDQAKFDAKEQLQSAIREKESLLLLCKKRGIL